MYCELRNQLKYYDDAEVGQLLRAVLEYGATGVLPEFKDRGMAVIWSNIQEKIDRDRQKYSQQIGSRRYSSYCRYARQRGEEPLPYEEWLEMQEMPTQKKPHQNPNTPKRGIDDKTRREALSSNW